MDMWIEYGTSVPKGLLYPVLALLLVITYALVGAVYNVFFHPLRNYPGPLLQRASSLPFFFQHIGGVKPFHTQKLHEKYGPVVRIAPNHLNFTDAQAWKDIYGHRVGAGNSVPELPKAEAFYKANRLLPTQIINSDREEHQRLRRALAHGFSDKALRDQEVMITRHVDLLLERLGERCDGGKEPMDMAKWYNWTTFDIIGDLVFAQDFGGLANSSYHPFVSRIFESTRMAAKFSGLRYLGFGSLVSRLQRLGSLTKNIRVIMDQMEKRLQARLDAGAERPDLIEGLIKRKEEWNLDFKKLQANSTILTLAGSETTATLLSGATYLLLTNPDVMRKLTEEVRSHFKSADEIDLTSVGSLTYMLAVLNESLRCYPPVTAGLVRTVPGDGLDIAGHFVPPGTYVEVQPWSVNHSRDNWADPWSFNPERFLAGDKAEDSIEALQPFSVGPRNCIGRNLAITEMRLILARVLFAFDMKLAPGSEDWIGRQISFTIWEKPALPVYLTPVAG